MLELTISSTTTTDGDDLDVITVRASNMNLVLFNDELLNSMALVELVRFYGVGAEDYRLERTYESDPEEWSQADFRVIGNG